MPFFGPPSLHYHHDNFQRAHKSNTRPVKILLKLDENIRGDDHPMTIRYLEYPPVDGYLHNWLFAGPEMFPVEETAAPDWKLNAARRLLDRELTVGQPIERGALTEGVTWQYMRSQEDHWAEIPAFSEARQVFRVWAYARLVTKQPGEADLVLSTTALAQVWVNGQLVHQVESLPTGGEVQQVRFKVDLQAENDLVLRFAQAGARGVTMVWSLRVEGQPAESLQVELPTQARFPHRFKKFEELFDQAYLEEAASYRGRVVNLRFAEDAGDDLHYAYSVQDAQSMIYVEGTWNVGESKPVDIGHPQRIFERPARVVLRAPGKEYYEQSLRYQRSMPIYILDNEYSTEPYADYPNRRSEALQDAARRDGSVFAEAAKMALGRWGDVDARVFTDAVNKVRANAAGSEVLLVGLAGILARFGEHESFPRGAFEGFKEAAAGFVYSGDDSVSSVDFSRESSEILLYTGQILAAQAFSEQVFAGSGLPGGQARPEAERKAQGWLRRQGERGFTEWDSPESLERIIVALSHLAGLAEDENLRDLAAVLLDKVLFLMAVNSYQGVLGGSMGRGSAAYESAAVKSGRLQATAGISRLLWGVGIFSAQTAGVVSMALSEYEFPSFFAEIATALTQEMWSRERVQSGEGEVYKVVYRTPDYLLGSAQNYCPGSLGDGEHIWQATLGPDALVFVNHPATFSQNANRVPGFWLGNGVLPRVVQWKDTLVAIYDTTEDHGLDFTHAYFPTYAFDEHAFEGEWAFARKGDGYLAITAAAGFDLITRAPDGYRELRSTGRRNIWLCQMGRAEQDGSFEQFRQKVQAVRPEWQELGVRFTSIRGDELSLGWEGPFFLNGVKAMISGFGHVDNPYCRADYPASQMDIAYDDIVLRLDFQ
jgi:hypothetical protein